MSDIEVHNLHVGKHDDTVAVTVEHVENGAHSLLLPIWTFFISLCPQNIFLSVGKIYIYTNPLSGSVRFDVVLTTTQNAITIATVLQSQHSPAQDV